MKAISLWQPWATLIVTGAKKIETRGWFTAYRGPLIIHAAKRKIKKELLEYAEYEAFAAAFGAISPVDLLHTLLNLPYGEIVGTAELTSCRRTEMIDDAELREIRELNASQCWTEFELGDFSPGRYGWGLDNPKSCRPIPYKGEQGLFEVSEAIFE